jgi:hypothetical protein
MNAAGANTRGGRPNVHGWPTDHTRSTACSQLRSTLHGALVQVNGFCAIQRLQKKLLFLSSSWWPFLPNPTMTPNHIAQPPDPLTLAHLARNTKRPRRQADGHRPASNSNQSAPISVNSPETLEFKVLG